MHGLSRLAGANEASVSRSAAKNGASRSTLHWRNGAGQRAGEDDAIFRANTPHRKEPGCGRSRPRNAPPLNALNRPRTDAASDSAAGPHRGRAAENRDWPTPDRAAANRLERCAPGRRDPPARLSSSLRPLDQSLAELSPFGRRHEQRDQVQRPWPLQPCGIAVDIVGDAVFVNHAARIVPPPLQFFGSQFVQHGNERTPMLGGRTVGMEHLVGNEGCRT